MEKSGYGEKRSIEGESEVLKERGTDLTGEMLRRMDGA